MSDPVPRSFAAQISELADAIRSDWRWPSPDAAFTVWLAHKVRASLPVDIEAIDIDALRWEQAPVLAATGFLASAGATDHEVGQVWCAGIERVMGRDPLPDDRNSFVYRPVELLGVVAGAVALQHDEAIEWLRTTMLRAESPSDPWAHALTAWACHLVGSEVEAVRDARDTSATALLLLSGADGIDPNRFLEQAIVDGRMPSNLPRIAARWAALQSVVGPAAHGFLSSAGDPVRLIEGVCRRFPAFARQIGQRHDGRPTIEFNDEYDVQDALHAVLRLHFDDVRPEEPTPSRAAKGSRIDLLLKSEGIVIETKMMRASLSQKKLLDEIAADKERYRAHPDCGTIVFFVYDPHGRLDNPVALERDVSETIGGTACLVIVAPREHGAETPG